MTTSLPRSLVSYTESGYPQPSPAAVTHTGQPSQPTRGTPAPLPAAGPGSESRRRVRWFALAAAALTAVLLVAGAVAVTASGPSTEPQQQVAAWFATLANRDAARLDVAECHGNLLCNRAGLATGYLPPDQVHVTASYPSDRGKDSRIVPVSYTVAGVRYDDSVGVTRTRRGFFGHQWLITEPPGGWLDLHGDHWARAQLAGITLFPNAPDTAWRRLWAPPGQYTITTPGDELFDPVNLTVTVAGGHPSNPINLPTTVKAGIVEQVNQQIHARIDQCAAQPALRPDIDTTPLTRNDCPFGYDSQYAITDRPHWSIRAYPTVQLDVDDHGTVTVHTTIPGKATISYQWTLDVLEPRRWTTATATQDIVVGGHVTIDQTTITWVSG